MAIDKYTRFKRLSYSLIDLIVTTLFSTLPPLWQCLRIDVFQCLKLKYVRPQMFKFYSMQYPGKYGNCTICSNFTLFQTSQSKFNFLFPCETEIN